MDDKSDAEFFRKLMDAILEDEKLAVGDNDIGVFRMRKSESTLKQITSGVGVKIHSKYNEPLPSMGVISITGKEIKFLDTARFLEIAESASNMDVYSDDGSVVRIDFTFYGLKRK